MFEEFGKTTNNLDTFLVYENGGAGSGNFGHAGRLGEVGGSAPSLSGYGKEVAKMADSIPANIHEAGSLKQRVVALAESVSQAEKRGREVRDVFDKGIKTDREYKHAEKLYTTAKEVAEKARQEQIAVCDALRKTGDKKAEKIADSISLATHYATLQGSDSYGRRGAELVEYRSEHQDEKD